MTEIMDSLCKESLSQLRYYERRIAEIPEEIAQEQERLTTIKSSMSNTAPAHGGGNKREEWICASLDRIEQLKADIPYFEGKARITHNALSMLDEEERRILEVLYIDKIKNGTESLGDELCMDTRTIWRKRINALENYCRARYGTVGG